jgi:hypothetical protein
MARYQNTPTWQSIEEGKLQSFIKDKFVILQHNSLVNDRNLYCCIYKSTYTIKNGRIMYLSKEPAITVSSDYKTNQIVQLADSTSMYVDDVAAFSVVDGGYRTYKNLYKLYKTPYNLIENIYKKGTSVVDSVKDKYNDFTMNQTNSLEAYIIKIFNGDYIIMILDKRKIINRYDINTYNIGSNFIKLASLKKDNDWVFVEHTKYGQIKFINIDRYILPSVRKVDIKDFAPMNNYFSKFISEFKECLMTSEQYIYQ